MLERILSAIETINDPARIYQLKTYLNNFMKQEMIKNGQKADEREVVAKIFCETEILPLDIIPPPPTNTPPAPPSVPPPPTNVPSIPPPPPPSFTGTKADIKTNIIMAGVKVSKIREAREILESDLQAKAKTKERDGEIQNG